MKVSVSYRVLFRGEVEPYTDPDEALAGLSALLRLEERQARRLFSGHEFVLKSDVDEPTAMRYAMAIAATGCVCKVDLMPDPDDPSQQPGFEERRKLDRREGRAQHTYMGRRQTRGRRKSDYAFLLSNTVTLAKTRSD